MEVLPSSLYCSFSLLHFFFSAFSFPLPSNSPQQWQPRWCVSYISLDSQAFWIIISVVFESVLNFFELYTSAQSLIRGIPWHMSLRSPPRVMASSSSADHNCAVMNVLTQASLWICGRFSLARILEVGYRIHTALILWNAVRLLVSSSSQQQHMRLTASLYPHQHLTLSDFLNFSILIGVKWYLTVLICLSLMSNKVVHLFLMLAI